MPPAPPKLVRRAKALEILADLPRYYAQTGPEFIPETNTRPRGGGRF